MIKATINRYLRRLPLALKAVVLTALIGSFSWLLFDHAHHWRMKPLFQDFLFKELQHRSLAHWEGLDSRLRSQSRIARLLVQRQAFLVHVAHAWGQTSAGADRPVPIHHQKIPPWLPRKGILRDLIDAPYLFLFDTRGGLRESYSEIDTELPAMLLDELVVGLERMESEDSIRLVDGTAYLLTRVKAVDTFDVGMAFLVLVTPLDSNYLLSFRGSAASDAVMVLLSLDGRCVSASARPDIVAVGTSVDLLKQRYLIQSRPLLDYGFSSDDFVQVATLMPLSVVSELSQAVAHIDRSLRTVGFIGLLLSFIGIIMWLVGRIQAFTHEMLTFSKRYLGSEPVSMRGGDQLMIMGEQFRTMMASVVEVRRSLEDREKELTLANKSLWESLVMVKRTQAKLLETEKMAYLGGLVAGVAHEINTPVGIGITAASFLDAKCRDLNALLESGTMKRADLVAFIKDARESSEMVLNNLQRAADLIRSFKQVAVDQSSEEKRLFNVGQYIQQIFKSLQPRLKKTRIGISTECPDNLEYNGFPGVLSQIVTNLVENSIKHGFEPDGVGEIRLQIELVAGNIRMVYSDSGRGMTENVMEHIFEPFFTTARNKGGSGLGLHIVYNLVTQTLGGSIHCESGPGQGVRFIIVFPGLEGLFHG